MKDGKIVLAKGYGKRSLQEGRPVETDTLFAVGSVSKQFTCAAILLLAEDGKFRFRSGCEILSKPHSREGHHAARSHEPRFRLSGLLPARFCRPPHDEPDCEDELLRQYAFGKLDFEPGTKWSYSNTGYILLGRVVEKVSHENLGAFLTRNFQATRHESHFLRTRRIRCAARDRISEFCVERPGSDSPRSEWLAARRGRPLLNAERSRQVGPRAYGGQSAQAGFLRHS